jgi:hypothetical protein
MADKKISELTELTTPDGTEELVVNDSGVSKKVQIDNLLAGGTISNFTSTGIDDNATSTAITIDASENVGIGVAVPTYKVDIVGNDAATVFVNVDNANTTAGSGSGIRFESSVVTGVQDARIYTSCPDNNSVNLIFKQEINGVNGAVETMRIDYTGKVLVGKTTQDLSTEGISINPLGYIQVTESSSPTLYLNRLSTDGSIVNFYKDGSTVGSIGTNNGHPYFAGTTAGIRVVGAIVRPSDHVGNNNDNAVDLGYASARYDDVYATNGTIQTSDRNEKQDIEELTEAEQRVAVACKSLMRKFRWKDKVAEKGDDARIHFGIIAQDLQDAFAAEGLDAGRYAMFISTTWYEKLVPVDAVIGVEAVEATYDDEGAELTPAVEAVEAKDAYTRTDTEDEPTDGYTERTRLGVRYPELLAFIISAI